MSRFLVSQTRLSLTGLSSDALKGLSLLGQACL